MPWLLVLVAVLGGGALVYREYQSAEWISTDDAFVAGNVVTVAAQASGTVVAIETDNTRLVQAGEVLVRLDGIKARLELDEARAALAEAVRGVAVSPVREHPAVQRAVATLLRRGLEVERSEIRAPVTGRVAKRKVQPGDVVQPGTPLLAIVPQTPVWVDANFRETELAGLAVGQEAELDLHTVAGPQRYHGVVEGFNPGTGSVFALLPPENASGNFVHIVERLPVRIALDADEVAARPLPLGLSVNVRVRRGQPAQAPRTLQPRYETAVFAGELKRYERDADDIIARNLR